MWFLKCFLKNLKETLFDKDIIIVLLLGPIVLTLLFGGIYVNDYLEDIPVVVLDMDNSSMSKMIIQQFDEHERFNVNYQVDSEQDLKELIDLRKVHLGVVIPKDFSRDVTTLKTSEVLILVDGSNMIIGNNAYAQAADIIQTIAAGGQIKLIEAKGIVPAQSKQMAMPFMFADRILYDPKMTYINYLLLGYIAVFLQQVTLSGVGISIIKHGEMIAEEKTTRKIFCKILASGFYSVLSVFISIWIASNIFKVQIRGDLSIILLMSVIFVFAISAPAIILASIVKDKIKFTQISYMLSIPTFISAGFLWTIDQLPQPLVVGAKALWPLIYFARTFSEVLFKDLPFSIAKENIIQMSIYTLIWLPIAIFIFRRRFRVKQEAE